MIRSSCRNFIRRVGVSICLCSISAVVMLSQSSALPETVVITVGDLKITAAEVEKIVASMPPQNRQYFASPAGRTQFAEFLIKTKLFVREAEKRHLEDREDVMRSRHCFEKACCPGRSRRNW